MSLFGLGKQLFRAVEGVVDLATKPIEDLAESVADGLDELKEDDK